MLTAISETKIEIIKIPNMYKNQFLLIVCTMTISLLSAHTIDLSQIEDRMKGGKICDVDKAPFVVTIFKIPVNIYDLSTFSGVIVAPKFVVTVISPKEKITDPTTEFYNIVAGCEVQPSNCSTRQVVESTKMTELPEFNKVILLECEKEFELGPKVAVAKFQTKKQGFATECKKGTIINRSDFNETGGEGFIYTECAEVTLTDEPSTCRSPDVLRKVVLLVLIDDKFHLHTSDLGGPLVCDGYVVGMHIFSLSTTTDQTRGKCAAYINFEGLYQWMNEFAHLNLPDWSLTRKPYIDPWPLVKTSNTERNDNEDTTTSNETRDAREASPASTPNPINILIIFTVLLAIF